MIELLKNIVSKFINIQPIVDSTVDQDCRVVNGSFQISQCTVPEKLLINGAATFGENTRVQSAVTVNGKLDATGSIFEGNLTTNGTAKLSQTTLKNNAHFRGNLTATDCQMVGDINLLAQKAIFIHSQISHITVQKLPYANTTQILYIQEGSVVSGDISFESGLGEVRLDESSIINGNVNGGRIISV